MHIGLCVPLSCSDEEIGRLTQIYLDKKLEPSLESKLDVVAVKNLKRTTKFLEKTSVKLLMYVRRCTMLNIYDLGCYTDSLFNTFFTEFLLVLHFY